MSEKTKHIQTRNDTVLMVVDVQTNHYPHCVNRDEALDTMTRVVRAAEVLGVPTVLTEHYPKVFGPTLPELAEALVDVEPMAKMHFSCLGDPDIRAKIEGVGAKNIVIIGSETHICIMQTALMARELGYDVAVVADAVTGRKELDHELGLRRLTAHGVDVLTWESLVYEWMVRGGTKEFKAILPLVKA